MHTHTCIHTCIHIILLFILLLLSLSLPTLSLALPLEQIYRLTRYPNSELDLLASPRESKYNVPLAAPSPLPEYHTPMSLNNSPEYPIP